MAAAILVVTGTTVYLTRPSAGESLFQRYFEAYPSTQPVVRGSATDTSSDALALYESGDYRRALASFEESLTAHPDAARVHFYAGVCRLALGRNAEAIADLEQSRKLGAGELDAPAEWYLALAELRIRNIGEARSRLQRIVAGGGFYADRARALLGELG
jgi:tetratricopeptide (TPR) repeat protein